jgi:hypothetical protein
VGTRSTKEWGTRRTEGTRSTKERGTRRTKKWGTRRTEGTRSTKEWGTRRTEGTRSTKERGTRRTEGTRSTKGDFFLNSLMRKNKMDLKRLLVKQVQNCYQLLSFQILLFGKLKSIASSN